MQDISLADLCEYIESGSEPPRLREMEDRVGRWTLRSGILDLLQWLKAQARRGHEFRPLKLGRFGDGRLKEGSAALCELVRTSPELARLFVCDGKYVAFREELSLGERRGIKDYVDARSSPSSEDGDG